jgi:hypothetical protein
MAHFVALREIVCSDRVIKLGDIFEASIQKKGAFLQADGTLGYLLSYDDCKRIDLIALYQEAHQELLQRREEVKELMAEKEILLQQIERTLDEQQPLKVQLPKEVADAIEYVKKNNKLGFIYDLDGIKRAFETLGDPYGIVWRYANHSRAQMILYFNALVNDYTVEETDADRIKRGVKAIVDGWLVSGFVFKNPKDEADLLQRITELVQGFYSKK